MVPCGCCCCCCCCCLHSLGGLIGAAVASIPRKDTAWSDRWPPADDSELRAGRIDDVRRTEFQSDRPRTGLSAVGLYWLLVVVLSAAMPLWAALFASVRANEIVISLVILALVLPGIQLAASVIACLLVVCFYSDKVWSLRALGWITLWSVLGRSSAWRSCGGSMCRVYEIGRRKFPSRGVGT